MRFLLATLLGLHAVAHVVGFVWPWWVTEALPYGTSDGGTQLIGDASMRTLSVLWLVTGIGFWFASLARLVNARSWRDITAAAASASLVLSIASAPGSLPGLPINLAIIALLRLGAPRRRGRSHESLVVGTPTVRRSIPAWHALVALYHPVHASGRRQS